MKLENRPVRIAGEMCIRDSHYLLKPDNRKELTDIIDKMKAKLKAGRRQSQAAEEKGSPIESDNKWIVEMVDYVQKNIANSEPVSYTHLINP